MARWSTPRPVVCRLRRRPCGRLPSGALPIEPATKLRLVVNLETKALSLLDRTDEIIE
jgi:hypothetical protein